MALSVKEDVMIKNQELAFWANKAYWRPMCTRLGGK